MGIGSCGVLLALVWRLWNDYNGGRPIAIVESLNAGVRLRAHEVDMNNYTGLIIVVSPACGFSRTFWNEASRDSEFLRLLATNSHFIADTWTDTTHDTLANHAARSPDMPFNIVHKRVDWPEVHKWSSPMFHALKNGDVVSVKEGWPKQSETYARVKSYARRAGPSTLAVEDNN